MNDGSGVLSSFCCLLEEPKKMNAAVKKDFFSTDVKRKENKDNKPNNQLIRNNLFSWLHYDPMKSSVIPQMLSLGYKAGFVFFSLLFIIDYDALTNTRAITVEACFSLEHQRVSVADPVMESRNSSVRQLKTHPHTHAHTCPSPQTRPH